MTADDVLINKKALPGNDFIFSISMGRRRITMKVIIFYFKISTLPLMFRTGILNVQIF